MCTSSLEEPVVALLALYVGSNLSVRRISRGTYQRWEDPYKNNATLKTLEKVAQALGKQLEVSLV